MTAQLYSFEATVILLQVPTCKDAVQSSSKFALDQAKVQVVQAIRKRYPHMAGSAEACLIGAIAEAAVINSLATASFGFEISPSPLSAITAAVRPIKRHTPYRKTKLKILIRTAAFCRDLFSLGPVTSIDKTLLLNLQVILPDASRDIKLLLPEVAWPDQDTAAMASTSGQEMQGTDTAAPVTVNIPQEAQGCLMCKVRS